MKHTELNEKVYAAPEMSVVNIAAEKGFAASDGYASTEDITSDPTLIGW